MAPLDGFVAVLLMLAAALAGLVLIPFGLPGLWLIVLAIIGYGWLTDFQTMSAWFLFLVIALALGELEVPRGWTVWGALLVTGVFASALAYLIQVWAQRRISAARIAIVFSLETVFAGLFGYWLSGDRLGWLGWGGCAVILAGIVVAEPSAAATLRRLVGWRPTLLPSD